MEKFGAGYLHGCPHPGCWPAAMHLSSQAQDEIAELLNDKGLQLEYSKQSL